MVTGNRISLAATAGASNGILPASAVLVRSSLINKSLFSLVLIAGVPIGFCRLIRGGLQYMPVDWCHFVILKTSLVSIIESSLSAQYFIFALRTVFCRLRAVLTENSAQFSCTAILQSVFHHSWLVFWPRDLFADLM